MKHTLAVIMALLSTGATALPQTEGERDTGKNARGTGDAEIRQILADRIDIAKQSVGIVVGTIDGKGRRIVAYGRAGQEAYPTLNGDTVFEIGSITKVFTALVLADMVQHGEVALSDPVGKYLPKDVKVPERGGKAITLQDLATHLSGLPRLPTNFAPKSAANPYADYSAENLYGFLSGYTLPRDPGEKWEYSNLGTGLLGHVLTLRAGSSYEAMVRSRVTRPLKMNDTAITLSPEMKARLAVGHNGKLAAVPNWDFQALAGAGALRSTANDMLTFLGANLGYTESPLAPAMAAMLAIRKPSTAPGLEQALGWQVTKGPSKEIVWKDGGTFGYSSFIGFDPEAKAGVVVLSNTFTMAGVIDIGLHLLVPALPLMKAEPPKEHKEISVETKLLDTYVGRYELAPNFILTITREGGHLGAQATGQGKFDLFAEGERKFFAKIADIQITFEGEALVLTQNGAGMRAKKL